MTDTLNRDAAIEKVGDHAITITRDFDAAVDKVFRAMHEPDLVAQWIGPGRLSNTEVTQVNQHGGTWTLVQTDDDGNDFAFRGVVHGDPTPERSQRTFEWLGMPGHVSLESMHLEDLGDDRTRVHQVTVFLSVEDRDGMWDSGMGDGVNAGFAQLDELLTSL